MTMVQGVASEAGAERKLPRGVVVEGPLVDAKFLDSYVAFALMVGGSIAALIWAFWQGIGWVEVSVFAGTFIMARSASASCIATSCTAAFAAALSCARSWPRSPRWRCRARC